MRFARALRSFCFVNTETKNALWSMPSLPATDRLTSVSPVASRFPLTSREASTFRLLPFMLLARR